MDSEVISGRWSEGDPLPPEDWIRAQVVRVDTDALYRQEALRLSRFFRRRVPQDDIADFVQDTFRKWLAAARVATDVLRPEAYLTTIATNLVRDRVKAERRQSAALASAGTDRVVPADSFQEALEARDTLARVNVAIAKMKPKTREIFLLHRLDGLDYAQIAERMEMSVKGVEWQMGSALDQIRRRVGRP